MDHEKAGAKSSADSADVSAATIEETLGASMARANEASADAASQDKALDPSEESTRALDAAQAQLASVLEELTAIKQHIDVTRMQNELDAENAQNTQTSASDLEGEAPVSDNPAAEIQELRSQIRHLKVDSEEANDRANRLAREKEELLASHARLEAQLRTTRRTLGETRRKLQHKEIDLQQYTGKPPVEPLDASESVDDDGDSLSSPMLKSLAAPPASKKESIAMQRLQAEVMDKEARHQKLDKRIRKERERVDGLVVLAERQHDEISCLRRQRAGAYAYAEQCEQRLKECMAHNEALQAAMRNVVPSSDAQLSASAPTPFGAGGGGGMTRNQSAPNRLPPCTTGGKTH